VFFGGAVFAPDLMIDSVNIQEYLQSHYCNAFVELIKRISSVSGLLDGVVIGYDTLNEPSQGISPHSLIIKGFIGTKDLTKFTEFELRKGDMPTPFQGMLLGSGFQAKVEVWDMKWYGPSRISTRVIDPKGASAWVQNSSAPSYPFSKSTTPGCIWAKHGVWDPSTLKCLKPHYFSTHPVTAKPIEFLEDFWVPFVEKFTKSIRSVHEHAIMFVEPPVNEAPPCMDEVVGTSNRFCYAPHVQLKLTRITQVV